MFFFSELPYFVPHLISFRPNSTVSLVMVFCTVNASKSNIHDGEQDVIYNQFAIL